MAVRDFRIRPPLPRLSKNDFLNIGEVAIAQIRIKDSERVRNVHGGPNPDLMNTNQFCIYSTKELESPIVLDRPKSRENTVI
jgi:hypothetical protein